MLQEAVCYLPLLEYVVVIWTFLWFLFGQYGGVGSAKENEFFLLRKYYENNKVFFGTSTFNLQISFVVLNKLKFRRKTLHHDKWVWVETSMICLYLVFEPLHQRSVLGSCESCNICLRKDIIRLLFFSWYLAITRNGIQPFHEVINFTKWKRYFIRTLIK